MCDILVRGEDAAKSLEDNILITKCLRFQVEYIEARKVKVTLYGVPTYISGCIRVYKLSKCLLIPDTLSESVLKNFIHITLSFDLAV